MKEFQSTTRSFVAREEEEKEGIFNGLKTRPTIFDLMKMCCQLKHVFCGSDFFSSARKEVKSEEMGEMHCQGSLNNREPL